MAKSVTGRLAKSDPALLKRTDSAPVSVMVKLDLDSVASYAGGVEGLAPTSPVVTGKPLEQQRNAVKAYTKHADQVLGDAAGDIKRAVPSAKVGDSFTSAYGGLAVKVPANQAKDLLSVPGVVAVQADSLEHTLTDATPAFVGATKVWPSLGGPTKAGAGRHRRRPRQRRLARAPVVRRPRHPGTRRRPVRLRSFGDGSSPALGAAVRLQRQAGRRPRLPRHLPRRWSARRRGEYCATTAGPCSARDSEGHGTHTATTAAGGPVAHAPVLGVDRGPVSGIAPGASVIAYRICLEQGCFGSDSVAAVQQAITDGVDVINFSISGGANPYTDPVELAFLDADGRRHQRQRLGRQLRPGGGHRRPRLARGSPRSAPPPRTATSSRP